MSGGDSFPSCGDNSKPQDMNYYNEHDPKAAAWLRELIAQGYLSKGVVDERSIEDVTPAELSAYAQCHFFAGIGGWSYALRLAGWPDDRPVWTGSCPCQPYSAAGKGLGDADPRNLWPVFFRLIRECRPELVFGEQVEAAVGKGWLDGISADLEGENYACGAAVLGAHSVNAPHIRQRLYWVAHNQGERRHGSAGMPRQAGRTVIEAGCGTGGVGNSTSDDERRLRQSGESHGRPISTGGPSSWSNYDLIPCRDGKARRVESGTFPLAHGIPGRVGLLRGYGNAIVPQVAKIFIESALDAIIA